MKTNFKHLIPFIFLFFSSTVLFGQAVLDSTKKTEKVIVKMKNGDAFKGEIIKRDQHILTLKTENGELNLLAMNISAIENETATEKFSNPNPHGTKYIFGSSGIPLKRNQVDYQNIFFSTHFVNYGITKNISVGGGFDLLSSIVGYPIWFLTSKVGVKVSKNIHVAGGIIMANGGFADFLAMGYGVFTLGTNESNLSVGTGHGFFSDKTVPLALIVNGLHRLNSTIALVSENYMIPSPHSSGYVGTHAIRILSTKSSFDIGMIIIPDFYQNGIALPFVGYARTFQGFKSKKTTHWL
jgi:small nuclear ribonucleoprotein (snRNP)-like protein